MGSELDSVVATNWLCSDALASVATTILRSMVKRLPLLLNLNQNFIAPQHR